MSGLIHVIHHLKTEFAQPLAHFHQIHVFAHRERNGGFIDDFLSHHLFCQGFRIGDHASQPGVGIPLIEHFGAQNFAWRIGLTVFNVALVAGGENERGSLATDLAKVVVEIARLIGIVSNNQVGRGAFGQLRKEYRCRRTRQSVDCHHMVTLGAKHFFQSLAPSLGVEHLT